MQALIITLHLIGCVVLVVLVLLQAGKEGMGVIFGGGSSSLFGSSGAGGILSKLTAYFAAFFFITTLGYTYISKDRSHSESIILDKPAAKSANATEKPAVPALPMGGAAVNATGKSSVPEVTLLPKPENATEKNLRLIDKSTGQEQENALDTTPAPATENKPEKGAGKKPAKKQ